MKPEKPLGGKAYGSIPHLPGSRTGPGDHCVAPYQASLLTCDTKSSTRTVIVQEKLDGSCVSVLRTESDIIPLVRSGYPADTSQYLQHRMFHDWAMGYRSWFMSSLDPGERVVGEWLAQAHGTRYDLSNNYDKVTADQSVFVPFDVIRGTKRATVQEFYWRFQQSFVLPKILHLGGALPISDAEALLGTHGHHGAIDPAEGVVYRLEDIEKHGKKDGPRRVVLVAKYVRPGKIDGKYLPDVGFNDENFYEEVWNWWPFD